MLNEHSVPICSCTDREFADSNERAMLTVVLRPKARCQPLPVRLRVPQLPRCRVELCPELTSNLSVSERLDYQSIQGRFSLPVLAHKRFDLSIPITLHKAESRTMGPTNLSQRATITPHAPEGTNRESNPDF